MTDDLLCTDCPGRQSMMCCLKHDPPLGACPSWCQKPAGHDWEDRWTDGVIRYHEYRVKMCDRYHSIGIDEIEQWQPGGVVARQREVILDLESPTQLSPGSALSYCRVIVDVVEMSLKDMTIEHQREVR